MLLTIIAFRPRAASITMPDVVFGLLLDICHNLFEVVHILFEFVEAALDHIVEHTFHTGLQETQVIVFYLMLSMAFGGLYYLWRVLPKLCQKLKANIISACIQRKTRLFGYWAEQSLINKIRANAESLNEEDEKNLKDLFKESITFD